MAINLENDDVDLDLEDEMSIDELAQNWVEAIPRREGLKLVHLPRDHVKRFLAAATINPGTVEAARKLQTRLKFSASVINVPAKSFLELCEAFITSSKAPAQPQTFAQLVASGDAALAQAFGAPASLVQPAEPANSPKIDPAKPESAASEAELAKSTSPDAPDQAIAGSVDSEVAERSDASEAQKTT